MKPQKPHQERGCKRNPATPLQRGNVLHFTGPLLGLIGSSLRAGRNGNGAEPFSEGVEDIVTVRPPQREVFSALFGRERPEEASYSVS